MNAAKFTPGPWIAKELDGAGWVDIVKLNDGGRESVPFAACKHFDQEANARLIAAAPELLDALHAADQTFAQNGLLACHAARQQISAAIAKATGGEA